MGLALDLALDRMIAGRGSRLIGCGGTAGLERRQPERSILGTQMGYKLKVPAQLLPTTLPSPEVLKNCGQNSGAYEPWFWEVEYLSYRYLERLSLDKLEARHADVSKSLFRLATPDRAHIPSKFFQSAWYWHRKEHQTRLEFLLRGVEPPAGLHATSGVHDAESRFPPNEVGDPRMLFRYTQKRFAEATRDSGVIRVAPAASYRNIEGDVARADEEMVKTIVLPGGHVKVTDMGGNTMSVIGDVRVNHGGPEYFVTCFSSAWDVRLFDDFPDTTHCVVVLDIDAFASRLEAAGRQHFAGWYFHHNPAWYFDPHESSLATHVSHATYKDFRFAYQEEYRFLWANHGGKPVEEAQFLELGSLVGIVEVVERASGH